MVSPLYVLTESKGIDRGEMEQQAEKTGKCEAPGQGLFNMDSTHDYNYHGEEEKSLQQLGRERQSHLLQGRSFSPESRIIEESFTSGW